MTDLREHLEDIFRRIDEYEKKLNKENADKIKYAIGPRLKMYRFEHNLTQEELASLLGFTRMEIIRWESERHVPSPSAMSVLKEKGIID